MLMAGRMPWDITAAGADGEKAAPAARPRAGRHLIAVMLLTAAVLDLTRCGLVLAAARHPAPICSVTCAADCCSDCGSVFSAMNSTPVISASIMRLTAFTP